MTAAADIRARMARIGTLPDGEVDLLETALLLAALERPRVPRDPYLRHVARLAEEVAAYAASAPATAAAKAEALTRVIARRYGYGPDAADGVDSADLMRVIDRRRGLPVAIGILYLQVAKILGWRMTGIDFPGRFLVRLEDGPDRVILDPAGARALDAQTLRQLLKATAGPDAELRGDHHRAIGNREVLVRLCNNVKARQARRRDLGGVVRTIETTLLFAPDAGPLWRELGLIKAKQGDVKAAVRAIEAYMQRATGDAARYRASLLLQELRRRLG